MMEESEKRKDKKGIRMLRVRRIRKTELARVVLVLVARHGVCSRALSSIAPRVSRLCRADEAIPMCHREGAGVSLKITSPLRTWAQQARGCRCGNALARELPTIRSGWWLLQ